MNNVVVVKKQRFLCRPATYFLTRDVIQVLCVTSAWVRGLVSLTNGAVAPLLGIEFRFRTFFWCISIAFPAICTENKHL